MEKEGLRGKSRRTAMGEGADGQGYGRERRRILSKCMLLGCIALGCALLAGCGSQPDRDTGSPMGTGASGSREEETELSGAHGADGADFFQIQSETEEIFGADETMRLICMQFYQGEPVQFRSKADRNEADELVADVYLYKEDGSVQLLLEKVEDPNRISRGKGLLAQDGSFYYMKLSKLTKWDSDGRVAYEKDSQELLLKDICQLADGTIVVLANNSSGVVRTMLMRLDAETGTLSEIDNVTLSNGGMTGTYKGIAAGSEGLLLMERTEGIYEIDLKSGSKTNLMSFQNAVAEVATQYDDKGRTMHDFRVLENGEVQILWAQAEAGIRETLRQVETDKTVLVLRGYDLSDQWFREQVAQFNRTNQVYQVRMDVAAEGVEWEDYATQTSIELAAGKGPDLLYGEVLGDYRQGILLKGGFADLRPYLERDGLNEEAYFPIAFCSYGMGDEVYTVSIEIDAEGWMVKGEVLGEEETPDIQTLVEALAAWPEEGCFLSCDEEDILRSFLEGSESLWGMIDWEQGTCDFSGDLFAKMLEAARRYAVTEGQKRPSVAWQTYLSSFRYFCASEAHKRMGNVAAGTLFDDGCFAKMRLKEGVLAVNANSSHKEGAWEFISFLLGDSAQMAMASEGERRTPVSRAAFDKAVKLWLEAMVREGTVSIGTSTFRNGKLSNNDDWVSYAAKDVTEEWTERYRQAMEEVKPLPIRTEPVLEIICQEAASYFDGSKDRGQVAETIRNRVQLYLDENL